MWRSLFLAIGITVCILGLECMVIEEAVLAKPVNTSPATAMATEAAMAFGENPRQIKTQEWMPWSFLFVGSVIIIYSITLPRRFQ